MRTDDKEFCELMEKRRSFLATEEDKQFFDRLNNQTDDTLAKILLSIVSSSMVLNPGDSLVHIIKDKWFSEK